MNRPDIAAFVLAGNAAWMLTGAGLMTLLIRRGRTSIDAVAIRNGLLVIGGGFGLVTFKLFAWGWVL